MLGLKEGEGKREGKRRQMEHNDEGSRRGFGPEGDERKNS